MASDTAEKLLAEGVKKRTSTTKIQVQELVAKARVAQAVFKG